MVADKDIHTPVKFSSIHLNDIINSGLRLEASVYNTDICHLNEIMSCIPDNKKKSIGEIAQTYVRSRFKRIWVEYSDYPIYQPSTILDISPEADGYISKATDVNIDSLRVHKNQVLVTCSGTIGKVAFVSDILDEKIFSHDLIRITCNDPIDAGYVYAVLKSHNGQLLLTTNEYGSVISHIEPLHLDRIVIPYPDIKVRTEISLLVNKTFTILDKAAILEKHAIKLLLDNLGLPESFYKYKRQQLNGSINFFSTKLSNLCNRLDVSYHDQLVQSIYKEFSVKGINVKPLNDIELSDSIFLPERFKRNYVSESHGINFFGIKQISELSPSAGKYLAKNSISKDLLTKLTLKENMILLSRSGTIGNIAIVLPHWNGWIASEDLIRLVPNPKYGGYIYAFLKSEIGNFLLRSLSFGSVQDHIDVTLVSNLKIPIINDESIISEINNLIAKANNLRSRANALEKSALTMTSNIFK